jgi:hypothetical protein
MIYYMYDIEEKDYHQLEETTCECGAEVRFLDSGDMLIIHASFINPEKGHSEESVNQAIEIIMKENNRLT